MSESTHAARATLSGSGLRDIAALLAGFGRGGDSYLVHVNKEEMEHLKRRGGSGSINPKTGLYEFLDGGGVGGGGVGGGDAGGGDAGGGGVGGGQGVGSGGDAEAGGNLPSFDSTGPAPQLADAEAAMTSSPALGATTVEPNVGKAANESVFDTAPAPGTTGLTGIAAIDNAIQNPVATGVNMLAGMVPGVGQINSALGIANAFGAGLPTLGSLAQGAFDGGVTGPPDSSQPDNGRGNVDQMRTDTPAIVLPTASTPASSTSATAAAPPAVAVPGPNDPGYNPVGTTRINTQGLPAGYVNVLRSLGYLTS